MESRAEGHGSRSHRIVESLKEPFANPENYRYIRNKYSCWCVLIDRKMKSTVAISLFIIYAGFSVGMTVSTHLCGDNVTSVSLLPFVPKDNACGCDDTAVPDGCCKTEIKSFQLSDEQIGIPHQHISSPYTGDQLWFAVVVAELPSSNSIRTFSPASSPPDSPPLTILHCSLLI